MKQQVLLDTGPLVALINRRDRFHEWVKAEWGKVQPPLLTCEAVLTEACFLLQGIYGGQEAVITFIRKGIVQISFCLKEEVNRISELLTRYRSVPMSLADACLVRMAEQHSEGIVFTLDSDFRIYQRNRNQFIPVIMPEVG